MRSRFGAGLPAFQRQQWAKMQSWRLHFPHTGNQQAWADAMPESVRHVCGHVQGPLLDALLRAVRHDDATLSADLQGGFHAVGDIPPSGTWAPRVEAAPVSLASILEAARRRQEEGRINLASEHRAELRHSDHEQVAKGRLEIVRGRSVPHIIDKLRQNFGDFVDLLFFGVAQGDKIRGCQGSRAGGVASATRLNEKMHMMGVDGVMALARAAAAVHLRVPLALAKVHWREMFYQAGLRPERRRYFVSFVVDVEAQETVAVVPQQCSRLPRAVAVVARRFFGILCDHHADDVVHCAPVHLADAEGTPQDVLILWGAPAEKAQRHSAELLDARGCCSPGAASKLAGRPAWTFSRSWGKSGGIFLRVLYDRAHGGSSVTSRRFRMSIDGLEDMLASPEDVLRRPVLRSPQARPRCISVGDARGRGEPYGTEALGAILFDWRFPRPEFFSLPVSRALERFLPAARRQRINEAEALWARLAARTWRTSLQDADITVVADSSAAEGVLRKGMSGSATLCCLNAEVWREENPADPLSRLDTSAAASLGWRRVASPSVPAQWHLDPAVWGR
ncbi:unnamed protein product [Prorocentrum cordatum]|uniref:RNA-directed RNA polymerase n=1 Tax=Prorocentrum cordatum TaxID=2364126 RepID=A0ABN9TW97_9DINO|nr:unnamed protein product [Polarella glacialis]